MRCSYFSSVFFAVMALLVCGVASAQDTGTLQVEILRDIGVVTHSPVPIVSPQERISAIERLHANIVTLRQVAGLEEQQWLQEQIDVLVLWAYQNRRDKVNIIRLIEMMLALSDEGLHGGIVACLQPRNLTGVTDDSLVRRIVREDIDFPLTQTLALRVLQRAKELSKVEAFPAHLRAQTVSGILFDRTLPLILRRNASAELTDLALQVMDESRGKFANNDRELQPALLEKIIADTRGDRLRAILRAWIVLTHIATDQQSPESGAATAALLTIAGQEWLPYIIDKQPPAGGPSFAERRAAVSAMELALSRSTAMASMSPEMLLRLMNYQVRLRRMPEARPVTELERQQMQAFGGLCARTIWLTVIMMPRVIDLRLAAADKDKVKLADLRYKASVRLKALQEAQEAIGNVVFLPEFFDLLGDFFSGAGITRSDVARDWIQGYMIISAQKGRGLQQRSALKWIARISQLGIPLEWEMDPLEGPRVNPEIDSFDTGLSSMIEYVAAIEEARDKNGPSGFTGPVVIPSGIPSQLAQDRIAEAMRAYERLFEGSAPQSIRPPQWQVRIEPRAGVR